MPAMNEIEVKQWKDFAKHGLPAFFTVLLFRILQGYAVPTRYALPIAVILPLFVFHFVPPRSPFGVGSVIRFTLLAAIAFLAGYLIEFY